MFDLTAFAASCGVVAPVEFAAKIEQLYEILMKANDSVNLTRITEHEEYLVKHVADSLLIARAFPRLAAKKLALCDIGCGGGFPSLVLSLAFPQWRICAIDSTGKKTAFVRAAAERLGLENCEVVTGRSRELDRKAEFRNRFDVVTARAVARGIVIASDAAHFPKRSGGFILYKTPNQAAEDLADFAGNPGNKWRVTPEIELPCDEGTRCFVTNTEL